MSNVIELQAFKKVNSGFLPFPLIFLSHLSKMEQNI
jgi:hypothetical protein